MPTPVTISDCARMGRLLLVWCRCGHRVEVDCSTLRLPPWTPIPGIESHFRCQSCGAKNSRVDFPIKSLMDPRQ